MPNNEPTLRVSQTQLVPIDRLRLDSDNPRLPESVTGTSQDVILSWMFDNEVLDELGRSFLENGYFSHEPMLVFPSEDDNTFTVLEGNRRLAALTILLQLPTAIEAVLSFPLLPTPTEEQSKELESIPCTVVVDKNEVRKFLGFRHIGGLKSWSPEAKARYIETEVNSAPDQSGIAPFQYVARLVGSTIPAIRAQYYSIRLLRAARDNGINVDYVLRNRFGVWNRLLNSPDVRQYLGFDDLNTIEDIRKAEQQVTPKSLVEIFADLTPQEGSSRAILRDSRDATIYGQILASNAAHETLKRTGDLSLARQIVERGNLDQRLKQLNASIIQLIGEIDTFAIESSTIDNASTLASSARTLHAALKAKHDDD